ncbi:hypothetical protein CREGCYN_04870 [Synechococcus sp. M16CYN]
MHELGHASGLWVRSLISTSVMAINQGGSPVLNLSKRDILTLTWLYQKPTRFGQLIKVKITP